MGGFPLGLHKHLSVAELISWAGYLLVLGLFVEERESLCHQTATLILSPCFVDASLVFL